MNKKGYASTQDARDAWHEVKDLAILEYTSNLNGKQLWVWHGAAHIKDTLPSARACPLKKTLVGISVDEYGVQDHRTNDR